MIEWFWDDKVGAFFDTASDAEQLITRPRDVTDNATPSGTSLAIELLLHLAELQQDAEYRRRAGFHARVARRANDFVSRPRSATCSDARTWSCTARSRSRSSASDHMQRFYRLLERTVAEQYVPSLVLAGGNFGERSTIKLLERSPAHR